jgi:hypothetical protein
MLLKGQVPGMRHKRETNNLLSQLIGSGILSRQRQGSKSLWEKKEPGSVADTLNCGVFPQGQSLPYFPHKILKTKTL